MKKRLIIIALVVSTFSFGQVGSDLSLRENIYKNINGLKLVDSVSLADIIGGFSKGDGYGGYTFQLDSNMTFEKCGYDCITRGILDSGSWKIQDNNVVVLKSKEQTLSFDIVKFDELYFFILPIQRQKFITDLLATEIKLKNAKPVKIGDRTYSVNNLIGFILTKKYYAKDLENFFNP
jgi:hypothetical protein